MVERLSLIDNSLFSSYAEDIQRHEFALDHIRGKRVLDAGCGTGYGSHFLAANGAKEVTGMDISEVAVKEATEHYRLANLHYECRDVEKICSEHRDFEAVTNFGSLPHLREPLAFVDGAAKVLEPGGKFIVTMPNGDTYPVDADGKPIYQYQFRTFSAYQLNEMLKPLFRNIRIYGQSLTHAGRLRKMRSKEIFDYLVEAYYNPMARIGRAVNVLRGRRIKQPPTYHGEGDSFMGDFIIHPIEAQPFPWLPSSLIAIADKPHG